jgi:hypothetical protein
VNPRSNVLWGGLARFGYFARGVVYLAIGGAAIAAALQARGKPLGPLGALKLVFRGPQGRWLILLVAVGLFSFAIFRLVSAGYARSKGFLVRAGDFVGGAAAALLGIGAVRLFAAGKAGGSGAKLAQAAAWLLRQAWGPRALQAAGAVLAIAGALEVLQAARSRFREDFVRRPMGPRLRRWAIGITRLGLLSHGALLLIAGGFCIAASRDANPKEVLETGGVLRWVARQPYGGALLGSAAAGLIAYGLSLWILARYRKA